MSKVKCLFVVVAGWSGSGESATLAILAPPWLRSTWKIICWRWRGFPTMPSPVSLMLKDWSSIHSRGTHTTNRPHSVADIRGHMYTHNIRMCIIMTYSYSVLSGFFCIPRFPSLLVSFVHQTYLAGFTEK